MDNGLGYPQNSKQDLVKKVLHTLSPEALQALEDCLRQLDFGTFTLIKRSNKVIGYETIIKQRSW